MIKGGVVHLKILLILFLLSSFLLGLLSVTIDRPFLFFFFFNLSLLQMRVCLSSQQQTLICTKNVIFALEDIHVSAFMGQLCWPAHRMLGRNTSLCIGVYLGIEKVEEAIYSSTL